MLGAKHNYKCLKRFNTSWFTKRNVNLKWLVLPSFKFIERVNIFCRRIITRPTPNSTADKIRKKKVSDNKFTLSYNKPTNKTKTYRVTQRNSAVSIKCRAVFILITILVKIKKKISNIKFTSPINIRSS